MTVSPHLVLAASEVDFRDRAFRENPHGTFTELRRKEPIAKVRGIDAYLLTKYKDCDALLKDPRIHLDELKPELYAAEHPMRPQRKWVAYFRKEKLISLRMFPSPSFLR